MARIPEHDIEQIKSEVSVERLVASAGIALAKSGKDRIGTCPFHEDGEPSLVVTPAKNLWHCFGCQIGPTAARMRCWQSRFLAARPRSVPKKCGGLPWR